MVLPTGLLVRGLRARQRLLPVPSTSTSCAPGASSMVRAYTAVSRVSERLQTTSCRGTAPLAESRGVDSLLQWLFAAPRVARRGLRAQQACAESATPSASPHLAPATACGADNTEAGGWPRSCQLSPTPTGQASSARACRGVGGAWENPLARLLLFCPPTARSRVCVVIAGTIFA